MAGKRAATSAISKDNPFGRDEASDDEDATEANTNSTVAPTERRKYHVLILVDF